MCLAAQQVSLTKPPNADHKAIVQKEYSQYYAMSDLFILGMQRLLQKKYGLSAREPKIEQGGKRS